MTRASRYVPCLTCAGVEAETQACRFFSYCGPRSRRAQRIPCPRVPRASGQRYKRACHFGYYIISVPSKSFEESSLTKDFIKSNSECPNVCSLGDRFMKEVFRGKVESRCMELGGWLGCSQESSSIVGYFNKWFHELVYGRFDAHWVNRIWWCAGVNCRAVNPRDGSLGGIVCDYGTPIYKARSVVAMLAALASCIEGHESLYTQAGMLQCDISTGNLMINQEDGNPSWQAFLIDLDLAVRDKREGPSGARGKTGTRAFMAIGVLHDNEKHSFMHDLESFFWVLFWICIHYNGPDEKLVVPQFDKWNYVHMEELAKLKLGTVADEEVFRQTATEYFTPYHERLVPWVNRLRRAVFPGGGKWKEEDRHLYARMKEILREAQKDPDVAD